MQQADDFVVESYALADILTGLPEADWEKPTQFKGWTINDVIVHLHFWNRAADLSLTAPDAFADFAARMIAQMPKQGMRAIENAEIAERGQALFAAWRAQVDQMGPRWAATDPKARLGWIGPDMSARSSITARQMETWAHGQEVFDQLGVERQATDRIRNVVVLGVNTFGWSHKVKGFDIPDQVPRLNLTAPSGALWEMGDPQSPDLIAGSAVDFAQVVTQVRNIRDTGLTVQGPVATRWMDTAQCFAGPPETPPVPGSRFTVAG